MSTSSPVRCLLLPLHKQTLILPNAMVSEVIYNETYEPSNNEMPSWLWGELLWREDQRVPLLCYEALCGWQAPGPSLRVQAVVLSTLSDSPQHMAIRIENVPRVEYLDAASLQASDSQHAEHPLVGSYVIVDGTPACIPDIDAVCEQLRTQWCEAELPMGDTIDF